VKPATETLASIVIGRVDFGEADRILKLLTASHGLVSVVARGARKSRRRYGGVLDLGNRLDIHIRRGRGELALVVGVDLVHGHPNLRADLDRLALGTYACEFVAALAREHHAEPRLFGLLEVALLVLDGAIVAPSDVWRWGLEAKALTFGGLTPRLDRCGVTGEPIGDGLAVWDLASGGLVLPEHGTGTPVTGAWAAQVERARRTPLADLVDVRPEPGPNSLLQDHFRWHTHKELRSRKLLADLRDRDGGI
jgi:DNA repair protein RecO (recombination protein O)